jgi:MraZ protein
MRAQSDGPVKGDDDSGLGSGSSSIRFSFQGSKSTGAEKEATRDVARRFRGEGLQKVDSKGRVSIPALFRRVVQACDPSWTEGLAPELVIVYGDTRREFLECYTIEAIEEVDAKIDALPRGSVGRKTLERLFHGQSFPTSIDETGRLVLPSKLRQKIGIDKEAYFIAAGDTFQIWNPETYEADQEKNDAWLCDQPDDFDPLTFLDVDGGA